MNTSRVCVASLAALALVSLAVPKLAAQAGREPKGRIAAIKVTGSKRYPEAQVVAASGLKVGEIIGREELQAAADRLAQLGPFLSARYRFTSTDENISAEFQVEDAPAISVSFDNFPWFTDAELTEALQQAVGLFDGTAPEQGSILDAMTETLQKLLANRGVRAKVEHGVMADPLGEAMIQQFKVVGAGLKVGAVEFTDLLAVESKALQERLSDLIGKPYSRFAVEVFVNEQVRPVYFAAGHLRVRLGHPRTGFTGNPDRPLPDNVLVVVPIEPGPIYRWAGAEWRGNSAFDAKALNEFLGLKADDTADGMKIIAGWQRVDQEYARGGYLDVKLQPEPIYDDAAQHVSYRVSINEGRVYRMGELVITGLSLAAENKLRDAWQLSRGQVFDKGYFDHFLAGLQKGGADFFGDLPVHYEQAGHWLRANPEKQIVDVLLDFK